MNTPPTAAVKSNPVFPMLFPLTAPMTTNDGTIIVAMEVPILVTKLLAAENVPSWLIPVFTVSKRMTSAIMEPGMMLSTANGSDTNKAKRTAVAMAYCPGKCSTRQIRNSATVNTTQPTIMGIFLPFCLVHLLMSG